jgi:hypothetical protein
MALLRISTPRRNNRRGRHGEGGRGRKGNKNRWGDKERGRGGEKIRWGDKERGRGGEDIKFQAPSTNNQIMTEISMPKIASLIVIFSQRGKQGKGVA